jgi:hypothetical protein
MVSPLRRPDERSKSDQRIAFFFTEEQARLLSVALGSLSRAKREPLQRELEMQLAQHGLLN